MVTALHLPEETFTLHLLLERFQRLIDVVIADHDLNYLKLSCRAPGRRPGYVETPKRPYALLLGMHWPVRRVILPLPSGQGHDGQAGVRYHRKSGLPTAPCLLAKAPETG